MEPVLNTESFLADIVEFAGGQWLKSVPRKKDERTIVVSCAKDKAAASAAAKAGLAVVDMELILTGLLRRELDLAKHALKQ